MWFDEKFYSQAQIDKFISEYENEFPGGINEFCAMLEDDSPDHKRKHGVHLRRLIDIARSSALFSECIRSLGHDVSDVSPDLFMTEVYNLHHDFTMRMRDICEARQR